MKTSYSKMNEEEAEKAYAARRQNMIEELKKN